MNRVVKFFLLCSSLLLFLGVSSFSTYQKDIPLFFRDSDTLEFQVPAGWPEPVYDFAKNPVTKNGFILGRKLFYDANLSLDSSTSCATCHLSYTNFTHVDHALSHGIQGRIGKRNTLAIINPAWQNSFMWDGGVNNIEVQPLAPMANPNEMDHPIEKVVDRLKGDKDYAIAYKKAFGQNANIDGEKTLKALTQFMITFSSYNSKYDQVMRKDSGVMFTESEQQGLEVFRANCSSCHIEPLFSSTEFKNNGLPVDTTLNDYGRMTITNDPADSLKFRVPTLRNIEVSYPYMHDGRFRNLQMVLFHYTHGIEQSETLADELKSPIVLSEDDKRNLIAFLKTLTDQKFLRNRDLAFPRTQ